jgi:tetratricopeptide (TPR) repeat protein
MRRITTIFVVLLIISLGASALVVRRVDEYRAGSALEEVLYIPSSAVLKRLSLGYNTLLADVYWTRAVQYFGSKYHVVSARYDLLAPLLDITTDLDPHLVVAYQFGGIFLAQRPPEGAGQPKQAVALVEKGILANPTEWRLYYNLGWIHVDNKDFAAAAEAFERGSRVPGANPALKVLAASMAQRGGEADTARFLWLQIYKSSDNKMLRANAVKHLQALQVDEDITLLEYAVAEYTRANGRPPGSLAELEASGWKGRGIDPVGKPYVIKPGGRVEVADYDQLPFITKGLPLGKTASHLPSTKGQREALQKTDDVLRQALPLAPDTQKGQP